MNTIHKMSFYQLFTANLKILYRNWRGLFFNIALPILLYVGLSILKIPVSPVVNGSPNIKYADYLLPGMIAMTIMQTGIFSLAYWLVDLRQRGVLKRFEVTPLSNTELIGSLLAVRLLLMLVQIILLTAIGVIFFDADLTGSLVGIILLMILGGAIFLTIGFLISTVANTYDEASPITTVLNLTFTFLGNIFFPTAVFPKVLRFIGAKLPISYLADGMRNNFLNQWTLIQTLPDILSLAIWLGALFALTVFVYRTKREI